jgi:hypothetical protein
MLPIRYWALNLKMDIKPLLHTPTVKGGIITLSA